MISVNEKIIIIGDTAPLDIHPDERARKEQLDKMHAKEELRQMTFDELIITPKEDDE
jgi:hypothetical protein